MRRAIRFAFLVLLFGLGPLSRPAAAQTGNPTHDAMTARTQADQRAELQRRLRDAGQGCTDVSALLFAGFDETRTAYWDVRCREGTRYRVALPAQRWQTAGVADCAALVPPPAGGPCFQPVQAATASVGFGATAAMEQSCRSTCASQPAGAVQACLSRCQQGGGTEVGTQASTTLPSNSRFGVIYHSELPLGAFGFGNGATDRLEVNMRAVRACQSAAGRTPCRFEAELVNTCGALAQAIRLGNNSVAITGDLRSFMVTRTAVGTGATQAIAEQAAMARCRVAETAGVTCRIVASGC